MQITCQMYDVRAMLKIEDFMVQSPTGKTHAINPKTQRTYCGCNPYTELRSTIIQRYKGLIEVPRINWRPLDVIPSKEHEPTCKVCKRHYANPLREEMQAIVNDLKASINEFLCTRIIILDVDGLGRFVTDIKNFMENERVRAAAKGGGHV